MEVVWSDLAFESFLNILQYIQNFFGEKTANDIAEEITHFVESLGRCPHLGKELSHLAWFGEIRCVFYKQNHIYYQIFENTIEVIIVWDGRQNPSNLHRLLVDFLSK